MQQRKTQVTLRMCMCESVHVPELDSEYVCVSEFYEHERAFIRLNYPAFAGFSCFYAVNGILRMNREINFLNIAYANFIP